MIKVLLPLVLLLISSFTFANTEQEIDHLLNFVEKSACTYQRNGSDHDGKSARKHMLIKADYYNEDIETAEDFIAYSATKSTMTGKKYTVICENQKVQFIEQWLNTELARYRGQLAEK